MSAVVVMVAASSLLASNNNNNNNALAQQQQTTTPPTTTASSTSNTTMLFTDDTGFTIIVPAGWNATDEDNRSAGERKEESGLGFAFLAFICPSEQLKTLSSTQKVYCGASETDFNIARYENFMNRSLFLFYLNENEPDRENNTATFQDVIDYYFNIMAPPDTMNRTIVNISDVTLSGPFTVRTTTTNGAATPQQLTNIPAKLVHYTYPAEQGILEFPNGKSITTIDSWNLFFVLSNTGYHLNYEQGGTETTPNGGATLPDNIKQSMMSVMIKW